MNMNPIQLLAVLALGGALVAACNPGRDDADAAGDDDYATTPAAPADVPPPPDDTGTVPGTDPTMPPAETAPTDQPPPDTANPSEPPPPNG
jgi:hypothetical protein